MSRWSSPCALEEARFIEQKAGLARYDYASENMLHQSHVVMYSGISVVQTVTALVVRSYHRPRRSRDSMVLMITTNRRTARRPQRRLWKRARLRAVPRARDRRATQPVRPARGELGRGADVVRAEEAAAAERDARRAEARPSRARHGGMLRGPSKTAPPSG